MTKVKLKQMRGDNQLDAVSPGDMKEAMRTASNWLTDKLKDRTERGPFSEAALGEPARLYFPKHAYMALKSGKWRWKKGLKLSTQLIRIMKSEMSHAIRDWYDKGEPELESLSRMAAADKDPDCTEEQILSRMHEYRVQMKTDMELAEELEAQATARDLGYKIAFAAANGDPKLLLYVQLVKELNDYRAIALKMRITMAAVMELEAELLRRVSIK